MSKYQQIYENAVTKKYKTRDQYAKIQFSSEEIKRFDGFKRVKRDIWYFYLILLVVVAVVLLIITVNNIDLFLNIWLTYIAIAALNTIIMAISIGIITQIIQNKAINARKNEEVVMNDAVDANNYLAKLSIVLSSVEENESYLNYLKNNGSLDEIEGKFIQKYLEFINEKHNNLATSDDFINYYRELLLNNEKNS